jgi:hypothetical protein
MRKKILGKIKYLGPKIGVEGFTDNKIYDVIEIDKITGALRIIDDSEDDYLYSPTNPKMLTEKYQGGRFEVVEDDEKGSLATAIYGKASQNNAQTDLNIAITGK